MDIVGVGIRFLHISTKTKAEPGRALGSTGTVGATPDSIRPSDPDLHPMRLTPRRPLGIRDVASHCPMKNAATRRTHQLDIRFPYGVYGVGSDAAIPSAYLWARSSGKSSTVSICRHEWLWRWGKVGMGQRQDILLLVRGNRMEGSRSYISCQNWRGSAVDGSLI